MVFSMSLSLFCTFVVRNVRNLYFAEEMDYVALEKTNQRNFARKTQKIKKLLSKKVAIPKENPQENSKSDGKGIIYVGHLPHGFYESELRNFFTQFGFVTNVRVSRSARTGKSRGYAFVEFQLAEVADIAAETMHNYLMFKRRLEVHSIEGANGKRYFKYTKPLDTKNYPVKWRRLLENRTKNTNLSLDKEKKQHKKTLGKLNSKLSKLDKLGITYSIKVNTE